MNARELEREFRHKVCEEVEVASEGLGRYVVHQPFMFADGDHFVVILREENARWVFTDEGHTLMHVQYDDLDLRHGTRARVLESVLNSYHVENQDGELRIQVPDGQYGDAFYTFLQALTKISDLEYLRQERVRSTFLGDVRSVLENLIPEDRREFDYHDPQRDPDRHYVVDCRVNGLAKPNFVFFIPRDSDSRCQNATIVCHQYEKWQVPFRATGIFEDQTTIGRRAVAQFSDVAYKQIPSLSSRDRLESYFAETLGSGG